LKKKVSEEVLEDDSLSKTRSMELNTYIHLLASVSGLIGQGNRATVEM
jgi:hypothetical protein